MTTTAAAENLAGRGAGEKKDEKVEKRRALGRGLESLLPGPRVVVPGSAGASVQGGGDGGEQQIPHFVRNDKISRDKASSDSASEEMEARRTGVSAPHEQLPSPPFAKDAKDGAPAPQGLKPESSSAGIGTAEAVPLPVSVDSVVGPTASGEMEARRTGVSAPHEPSSPPFAKDAKDGAPTVEDAQYEVISIQAVAETRAAHNLVTNLAIELIDKNPYQTRYVFDEEMLIELRESIKQHGVVQPVVVRPAAEEGRYILVLGERRLRASKMAGKETIPALVRRLSPQQAAEMTVLENVVREDLNPLEQAEAFRVLSKEFKLTQVQIAERIGVSRETVSNYMRLLRLPRKVMDYMLADRLSYSDAREILRLENDEYIEQVAEEVVTHRLKWDQIEDRVMRINGSFPMLLGQTMPGEQKKGRGARWVDPNVRAAQLELERLLGVRVRIRDRKGKGKIVIDYHTVEDYDRVVDALRGKK